MQISIKLVGAALGAALLCGTIYVAADSADGTNGTKLARSGSRLPSRSAALPAGPDEYVFGAAPGGSFADQTAVYQPIAEFLTRVTGKRFVYRYSDNWLSYSRDVTSGAFDLVFDSAALTSWQIDRMDHTPLLRLTGDTVYTVISRSADPKIRKLRQLAGHRVCAPPPPDTAALTLLTQFDNPARQPVITETRGWNETFRNVIAGKCDGGIIARKHLQKIDRSLVTVLYEHGALPNQALSAGPRISPRLQDVIRQALLTPQGRLATAKLRTANDGAELIPAHGKDYAGLDKLLKDSLYYN